MIDPAKIPPFLPLSTVTPIVRGEFPILPIQIRSALFGFKNSETSLLREENSDYRSCQLIGSFGWKITHLAFASVEQRLSGQDTGRLWKQKQVRWEWIRPLPFLEGSRKLTEISFDVVPSLKHQEFDVLVPILQSDEEVPRIQTRPNFLFDFGYQFWCQTGRSQKPKITEDWFMVGKIESDSEPHISTNSHYLCFYIKYSLIVFWKVLEAVNC